jgi:hypothetical protein
LFNFYGRFYARPIEAKTRLFNFNLIFDKHPLRSASLQIGTSLVLPLLYASKTIRFKNLAARCRRKRFQNQIKMRAKPKLCPQN